MHSIYISISSTNQPANHRVPSSSFFFSHLYTYLHTFLYNFSLFPLQANRHVFTNGVWLPIYDMYVLRTEYIYTLAYKPSRVGYNVSALLVNHTIISFHSIPFNKSTPSVLLFQWKPQVSRASLPTRTLWGRLSTNADRNAKLQHDQSRYGTLKYSSSSNRHAALTSRVSFIPFLSLPPPSHVPWKQPLS